MLDINILSNNDDFKIVSQTEEMVVLYPVQYKVPVTIDDSLVPLTEIKIIIKSRNDKLLCWVDTDPCCTIAVSTVPELMTHEEVPQYLSYLSERYQNNLIIQYLLKQLKPIIDREIYYLDQRRDCLYLVCNPLRSKLKFEVKQSQVVVDGQSYHCSDRQIIDCYHRFNHLCISQMIQQDNSSFSRICRNREDQAVEQALELVEQQSGVDSRLHYVLLMLYRNSKK